MELSYNINWTSLGSDKPTNTSSPKKKILDLFSETYSRLEKGDKHETPLEILERSQRSLMKTRATCDPEERQASVQKKIERNLGRERTGEKANFCENVKQANPLAQEFDVLARRWRHETFAISSLTKIYMHPSYQRIIAMGKDGLPLVLNALRENQGNWFYALKYMAGEDVSEGIKNFEDAKAAWIEWGYAHNYI